MSSAACLSLESEALATVPRELRANVFSHRWGVVVQVFVPGCNVGDVKVSLNGDSLTVIAAMPLRDRGIAISSERAMGECEREFGLTRDLDIGRLTRSIADGVLTMVIPRHGAMMSVASES
jgi:HSP20 family molecular chaperone IbpA